MSRLSAISIRQAACSSRSNIALPEACGPGHSSGPTLHNHAVYVQAVLDRAPSGWPRGPRRAGIAAGEGLEN